MKYRLPAVLHDSVRKSYFLESVSLSVALRISSPVDTITDKSYFQEAMMNEVEHVFPH